jgi:hypothetical protein
VVTASELTGGDLLCRQKKSLAEGSQLQTGMQAAAAVAAAHRTAASKQLSEVPCYVSSVILRRWLARSAAVTDAGEDRY